MSKKINAEKNDGWALKKKIETFNQLEKKPF